VSARRPLREARKKLPGGAREGRLARGGSGLQRAGTWRAPAPASGTDGDGSGNGDCSGTAAGRTGTEKGASMQIFSNVLGGLAGALEMHQQRHRVISENLANVETPGYRARDVAFHDALERAFAGDGRAAASRAEVVVDRSTPVKLDGNSVDLDLETTRLSDNAFRIVTLSRILAKKYAGLKETIAELR